MTVPGIAGFEVGGMGPQVKECGWLPLEAGKAIKQILPESLQEKPVCPHLVFSLVGPISNFWPPELEDNSIMLFLSY